MGTTSIILLALLAQAAPAAPASQDKARAQALLGEGAVLYEKGDYTSALEKFHAAYAAYSSPKIWFNIGQANRDLGRPVEALDAFQKFLDGVPHAAPEDKADAQASVADLQKRLGQLTIVCEATGAEISVDGKPVGAAPLPKPIWAVPGTHQVLAMRKGAPPAVERAEVSAGGNTTVFLKIAEGPALRPPVVPPSVTAPPPPVASPPVTTPLPPAEVVTAPPPPEPGRSRTWTWVAAGSTVALVGAAAGVGWSVSSRFDELKNSCGQTVAGCSDDDITSLRSRRNIANALWGLAGAAAVTTGVLFFVEGRPVAVAPVAGETTGMVARMEF